MSAADIAGWTVIGGIVILAIVLVTIESRRARKEAQEGGKSPTYASGPTEEEVRAFRERERKIIEQHHNMFGGVS